MAELKSFLIILTVNLLATTGDITLSWTSPMLPKLYSNDTSVNPLGKPISTWDDSVVSSILNVGALVGSVAFNPITQLFGYKKTLLSLALPHIISFLILAFGKNVYFFFVARFLAGLSVGAGYSLFSLYVGDISADQNRGSMISITNIFWSIGNFIPLAIGPYTSYVTFNLILTSIPVVFLVIFFIIGEESPYHLIRKSKTEKAENVLRQLRKTEKDATEELIKIETFVNDTSSNKSDGTIIDVLKDKILRKQLFICMILLATQDLGGYCSILYHLELIFRVAGSSLSEDKAALIVGIALIISSFIAPTLVDNYGRKPLLIISCAGMSLFLGLLGLFFFLDHKGVYVENIRMIPLFSLMCYIVFYNIGISTVPWNLMSELFPSNVKQAVCSTGAFCCWTTTAVVTFSYNYINVFMGIYGSFWLFSVWCLLITIFCVYYIVETKGKSFLEVQRMIYTA